MRCYDFQWHVPYRALLVDTRTIPAGGILDRGGGLGKFATQGSPQEER